MGTEMQLDPKIIEILKEYGQLQGIEVAFLIDSTGRLLVSVGTSPAFSPSGNFRQAIVEAESQDSSSCLYLTALTKETYLGILFSAQLTIEEVRAKVRPRQGEMAALLAR